ncbi:MAG: transcriptional regulator [Rhodospirillales bacterium CG15_BIG_FIL_POST_REV_8_21_14_020_66_15]|nr:MAG: transcriptional regulator [Rhodospirillales bacterium CG15_BIG_FIL_POST_REV_8_21_14_020_66_15]
MTPFGQSVRRLRKINRITLKQFAQDMGVSSAYFSALEHGYRGRPGPGLVQQIAGYFNLGTEETDELKRLAALSHPRITVDTAGLNPKATELANMLAELIHELDEDTIDWIINEIRGRRLNRARGGPTH